MRRTIEACGYAAAGLGFMLVQFLASPARAQLEVVISIGMMLILVGLVAAMLARRGARNGPRMPRDPLSTVHAGAR